MNECNYTADIVNETNILIVEKHVIAIKIYLLSLWVLGVFGNCAGYLITNCRSFNGGQRTNVNTIFIRSIFLANFFATLLMPPCTIIHLTIPRLSDWGRNQTYNVFLKRIHFPITNYIRNLSLCLTLALSAIQMIAAKYPFYYRKSFNLKENRWIIGLIAVYCLAWNLPFVNPFHTSYITYLDRGQIFMGIIWIKTIGVSMYTLVYMILLETFTVWLPIAGSTILKGILLVRLRRRRRNKIKPQSETNYTIPNERDLPVQTEHGVEKSTTTYSVVTDFTEGSKSVAVPNTEGPFCLLPSIKQLELKRIQPSSPYSSFSNGY